MDCELLSRVHVSEASAEGAPILLVEDDATVQEAMAGFVGRHGYRLVVARDAIDALVYLRRGGSASMVLVNAAMPSLDEAGFQRALRDDPRSADIPVVLYTACVRPVEDVRPDLTMDEPESEVEIVAEAVNLTRH